MPPRSILFDFDGTLIDSAPGILASFEAALRRTGLEPAVPLAHRLHHRPHSIGISDIRRQGRSTAGPHHVQLGGQTIRVHTGGAHIGMVEQHRCARSVKGARDLGTDALRGTGDQRDPTSEVNGNGHAVRE